MSILDVEQGGCTSEGSWKNESKSFRESIWTDDSLERRIGKWRRTYTVAAEWCRMVQENGSQLNVESNNNNRGHQIKWTKQLNMDFICHYFNTILWIPDEPYRTDFHTRWTTLHPEKLLTEQRICDQQRVIRKKAKNSRKHQKCLDHATWNASAEKRCIKGKWKWKN